MPGRFLKHLDTTQIRTLNEFEQEMKDSLPKTTTWNHPSGKTISNVGRESARQRLIDRADVLFGTDEVQYSISSNVGSSLERAETLEEVRAIPVNLSEYSSSTKDKLGVIKRVEASKRAREGIIQKRAKFFLEEIDRDLIDKSNFRTTGSVSSFYNVSEDEATNRLRDLGYEVDETGRIL